MFFIGYKFDLILVDFHGWILEQLQNAGVLLIKFDQ